MNDFHQPTYSDTTSLPFGGNLRLSYGRELSELGIHEFVNKTN
jgi:acyl-CoA reductase-like NAD-dependent aldehyde dehydrogenase